MALYIHLSLLATNRQVSLSTAEQTIPLLGEPINAKLIEKKNHLIFLKTDSTVGLKM